METEIANWMVHEYTSAVWQLQHAVDPAQTGRVKRNILGDFIGGVTGLVTHEQFAVDHKELKETEGRVEKILNHQINIEKLMEEMSHDMATKAGVIARLQDLRIRMERNAVYQTKKVTCRRGGKTSYKKKRTKKKSCQCFAHLALINRLILLFWVCLLLTLGWGGDIAGTKSEFKKGGVTLISPSSTNFTAVFLSSLSKGMELRFYSLKIRKMEKIRKRRHCFAHLVFISQ